MSDRQHTHATDPEHGDEPDEQRSLSELVTGAPPVAMVMTMIGTTHTSRPVTIADVDGARLMFLVSRQSEWVDAIATQAVAVHVTLTNDAHSTYLSLNGTAMVSSDPALRQQLWSPPASAWFSGPEDPDLAVLQFDVLDGRFWDGPDGRLGRGLAMLRAAVTGSDRNLGTQGSVATSGGQSS